jgi:hypothetical protein
MKAVILTLFALIASAFAFAPNQAPQGESTATRLRCVFELIVKSRSIRLMPHPVGVDASDPVFGL